METGEMNFDSIFSTSSFKILVLKVITVKSLMRESARFSAALPLQSRVFTVRASSPVASRISRAL